MHGHEHYRISESFLEHSKNHTDSGDERDRHIAEVAALQALTHAVLAQAAAVVEACAFGEGGIHISRPSPSDPEVGDRPWPGTPWGRAFFGDLHLAPTDKDA